MSTKTWHVAGFAAERYEAWMVPTIFAEWAPRLVAAAGVQSGDRVLDVGCGTGVAARAAAAQVGPEGRVTGLDLNPEMVAMARRLRPDLAWRQGDATALPFPAATFVRVLCQFGLMYVPDRVTALREMGRVATAGGTIVVAVWSNLDENSGFAVLRDLLDEYLGREAGDFLRAPFTLGNIDEVAGMSQTAGLHILRTESPVGKVTFPSIDAFVRAQVSGSPIAGLASAQDQASLQRLLDEARTALQPFLSADGCAFPAQVHIIVAWPGSS